MNSYDTDYIAAARYYRQLMAACDDPDLTKDVYHALANEPPDVMLTLIGALIGTIAGLTDAPRNWVTYTADMADHLEDFNPQVSATENIPPHDPYDPPASDGWSSDR